MAVTGVNAQATIAVNSISPTVMLEYDFAFHENVTALSSASVVLDSSNSSQAQVVGMVQGAMQRIVPGVVVNPSTFKMVASVKQQPGSSNMWIMSEDWVLTVTGAASNKPGVSSLNLAFVAMNVSDSILLGGTEFNNIGSTYLVNPINSQPTSTTFYLDRSLVRGGPYSNPVIPSLSTRGFNLLDFSWIPKISDWTHAYKPLDTSSSWTLKPGIDTSGLPYNLTMGVKTPEGTLLASRVAFYKLDLILTAPARAVANGSTISFGVPSTTDFVMPAIISGIVTLGVASFLAEKKLITPAARFKKKRR